LPRFKWKDAILAKSIINPAPFAISQILTIAAEGAATPLKGIMQQPDTLSLAGKVAVVTGSGRWGGLGAAIAFALARNGAAVAINYSTANTAERAGIVIDKLRLTGAKVLALQADVASAEGAQDLIVKTLEGFGADHIDILGEQHQA